MRQQPPLLRHRLLTIAVVILAVLIGYFMGGERSAQHAGGGTPQSLGTTVQREAERAPRTVPATAPAAQRAEAVAPAGA